MRAITDAAGSVLGSADYDPFGRVRTATAPGVFGFVGEQTDVTGLVFLRARYYNPTLGRFLTPDAFQPNAPGTQGYNLYSYVANNPTTWTDPTGNAVLIEYSVRAAAAGAIIGGVAGAVFCDNTALYDISFGDSYPGCIFRSTLAGAAGGAFFISGGGLWAALGTGGIGGFASGFVFQGTGALLGDQEFNPGAIVADTIIGAFTGGFLWGGGRIWQSIKSPRNPGSAGSGPSAVDDVVRLTPEESWGNLSRLDDHFGRHGADFGATSAADYANQASDFFQNGLQRGLPTKVDPSNGVIRIYDPVTNTFGSYNPNGTTATFFKPNPEIHGFSTNLEYWISQPGSAP